MRLSLIIITVLLLTGCSTRFDFDQIDLISYNWIRDFQANSKDSIRIRHFVSINKFGKCQIIKNTKVDRYEFYQFDIDKIMLDRLLNRLDLIHKDSILLKKLYVTGNSPFLDYIFQKDSKTKVVFTIMNYENTSDYYFLAFNSYIDSICKNKRYKPLKDTINIKKRLDIVIMGLSNNSILTIPPPPPIKQKLDNK